MGRLVRAQRAFSLIELMVTVAIIGVLAAVAIPAFVKYQRKAKTAEARIMLRKIYDGAYQYFFDDKYSGVTNMQPIPKQFPTYTNAANWTASPTSCAMGGNEEKSQPNQALWAADPHWMALHFEMVDPHYYAYQYLSVGAPPLTFFAFARGNLDCDNVYSQFSMYGFASPSYGDVTGTGLLQRQDELE
jgi:type IV pilus assembly protein PilA